MGLSVEGILTICLNGSALLNKMVYKPIYGKKHLKIFFSSTKKELKLNLGIQYWGLKVYQVCLIDETRMTFDLLMLWSNLCPSCGCNTGRMLHGICKYTIAVFIR